MTKQYFIPGLGANERVFEELGDFGTEKIMIQWLKNDGDESLRVYSQRIIDQYGITNSDIIVGLSFGGLIAQQIAEILGTSYVILISSFISKSQLRPMFTYGLKFRLHKLMPEMKATWISEIVANYLNSGTSKSRPLLTEMIEATDMKLMKWSIRKIYEQDEVIGNQTRKYNLIGKKDRIVSTWLNDSTFEIEGGTHFMVYDHAEEVSEIIKKILEIESNG